MLCIHSRVKLCFHRGHSGCVRLCADFQIGFVCFSQWLILFGVIAVIIAILGTIGEITSNETLEENILNWWLVIVRSFSCFRDYFVETLAFAVVLVDIHHGVYSNFPAGLGCLVI